MMKKILYEGLFRRFVSQDGWEYMERIHGLGIVAIIAITPESKLVFVEQHRVPVQRTVIELPAGIAGDLETASHENLEQAARRELLEETGYEADRMLEIAQGPASAASSSDIITLFKAEGLKKTGVGGGDHTESIIVHEVPCGEVPQWLSEMKAQGHHIDPTLYAALYLTDFKNLKSGPAS